MTKKTLKYVNLTGSEEIEVLPEAMLLRRRIIFMVADSTHNSVQPKPNPNFLNPNQKK